MKVEYTPVGSRTRRLYSEKSTGVHLVGDLMILVEAEPNMPKHYQMQVYCENGWTTANLDKEGVANYVGDAIRALGHELTTAVYIRVDLLKQEATT